ncbi:zwei Ig domain protein zig-8-like isoform X2 [Ruditapes philippinarum]|uniref:zwei Ig domain protein zig-8-like isoform X2 n=1 Tax=Ruditapes philippinarum TaxID=129788 RepID=UPI00295B8637|nr:zwei Ig domain protein zig-8-like isoform X2 [Ruditapes philippinarum]
MTIGWCKEVRRATFATTIVSVWIVTLIAVCAENVTSALTTRQTIPKFLQTPNNVTVHRGELAELMCHIQNLGPKTVVWRKASEENPLTLGTTIFPQAMEISINHADISPIESKWNLLIKNVQPKHAGVYECQISSTGIYTRYVALNVLKSPVVRKPKLTITGTQYVNRYNDIHLVCNATGVNRAPEDVDWFFNGNKIHTTHPHWYGRIEIVKHRPLPGRSYISELIIHLSTMEDQGNYVCRSSDLNVNSMNVHILNDKDTGIKIRAPGEESEKMKTAETGTRNKTSRAVISLTLFITHLLLLFTALT